ncbi:MAG: hypothetical protein BGP14_13385 [Sphingobacteriales bacterium 44-15]|nr:MAG: hypothetical protein BGP14_13385 [Sphingobacteriales bacterium 44-15]
MYSKFSHHFLPSPLRGEGIAGVRERYAAKIWNAPCIRLFQLGAFQFFAEGWRHLPAKKA